MSVNIAETFELLFDKNNSVAYKALQELQKESEKTDCVYPYMDRLSDMLGSDNSYIRTRGLTLLAHNAKWDKDHKIDEIIDKYLKHITDIKPLTARQCIKLLPVIAKDKPELKDDLPHPDAKSNPSCMQTYLLLQYGEVGNESEDLTVYHGSFGYQRNPEYLHPCEF